MMSGFLNISFSRSTVAVHDTEAFARAEWGEPFLWRQERLA